MGNAIVSVVIPTYSRPLKLKDAINSVLLQSFKQIEILVIDDNDSNSRERILTQKLIDEFRDERLKYITHKNNKGANAARNTGIKHSTGKYISFLDDDDLYYENNIEYKIKVIENEYHKNDDGILVFSGANIVGDPVYSKSKWMLNESGELYYPDRELIFARNYIGSTSFVLVDRHSLLKIGGFNESLKSCQDWDLYLRLSLTNSEIVGINKPLVQYNSHEEYRITNDKETKISGHKHIINTYIDEIKKRGKLFEFLRYEYYQVVREDKVMADDILTMIRDELSSPKQYLLYLFDRAMKIISSNNKIYDSIRRTKNLINI